MIGRDAWKRLCRNRLAVAGLAVSLAICLATLAAPIITGHDPTELHAWIGAQPPGFTHPDCLAENVFTVGERPESSATVRSALASVLIAADETVVESYRVALRRGLVNRINSIRDGTALNQLELTGEVQVADDAEAPAAVLATAATLRVGQAPPAGWFKSGEAVKFVRAQGEAKATGYDITLDNGVVTTVHRDGKPVDTANVSGKSCAQILVDGHEAVLSHPLGTDIGGRDLLSRILHGGRISLSVGVAATLVSLIIGVLYGAVAGYVGGRTDRLMMAAVDILYAIPFMFLVIILLVYFGRSMLMLFVALGAVQWLTMARIVRGQVLSLTQRDFVAAARLSGAGHWTIITRHLIANSLGPIVVFTALTVPTVILQESFLSFIGLSVQYQGQNLDSWGALVKAGVDALDYRTGDRTWLLVWPSAAMAATLLALNCLGDGLRDALDPQLRGRSL
jgi:oligopeptide transport system permease protein